MSKERKFRKLIRKIHAEERKRVWEIVQALEEGNKEKKFDARSGKKKAPFA